VIQVRKAAERGRFDHGWLDTWLQVLRGEIASFENKLVAVDGLAISDENTVAVRAATDSEVLLFDLA
jgi:redox-sensitive bicupin YhaK (pirin superfamily)